MISNILKNNGRRRRRRTKASFSKKFDISIAISIVNLVFICRIFIETKNNPFDSEKEEDKNSYFNDNFNSNLPLSSTLKQCKCGQNILNDFWTEELILSGYTFLSLKK